MTTFVVVRKSLFLFTSGYTVHYIAIVGADTETRSPNCLEGTHTPLHLFFNEGSVSLGYAFDRGGLSIHS